MRRSFWQDYRICYHLIVLYLVIGWFHWAFVLVPAKPDEIQHLTYVAEVRRGDVWPIRSPATETPCGLDERWQPPLYYWISALAVGPTVAPWPGEWVVPNPFFLVGAPRGNAVQCLHFPIGTPLLMAGRIWSWLLGTLAVCGAYRGARSWMGPPGAALTALLATTLPSVIFYQTGVGNTALFIPMNTLALAELAWIWRKGLSTRRLLRLSALVVATVYARLEGLFLLPLLALLFVREARSGFPTRRMLIAALGILLALSPMFLRNLLVYGDPLVRSGLAVRGESRDPMTWLRLEGPMFFRAVFISLGHAWLFGEEWMYWAIRIAGLIGGMGIARRLGRGDLPSIAWVLIAYTGLFLATVVHASLQHLIGGPRYVGSIGFAWLSLWTTGYLGWWPRSARRAGVVLGLIAVYGLSVAVISRVLLPAYMPQPAPRSDPPLARIAGKIILHRAVIEPSQARPGDVVTIRLVWEALEPIPQNYAVFVHALDPHEDRILAQEDTFPMYGHYPTMLWKPLQPFEEVHRLRLPDSLNVPRVRFTVGLYRYETGERAPAFSPAGVRFREGGGDAVPIGWIVIENR
ncbi:MAG: glycosyltransferase family 39 protein [Anaerolineae bacterium]|nr:glycosyltransferase family 39 protein [Thermoflexus sp.]MDW8065695.1 glycosyltransferase family 39 protein [Anaerolineae bacterium]